MNNRYTDGMSEMQKSGENLPKDEEVLLLDESGISESEKQEVLDQIDQVAEKNKISVSDELFEVTPKKKGALFPILINIVALLLVAGGVYYAYRAFGERQAILSMETQEYLSTEGKLIEEIRKESEMKLSQKEEEISKIQQELAELDEQSRELKENMEEEIADREEELKRELEEELAAERRKLEDRGASEEEIARRLDRLEAEKTEQYERQLEEFRQETEAALRVKEEELEQARQLTEEVLERANRERRQLEQETEQRIAELEQDFEEQRQALQSEKSEAQARLRELSKLREQEQLVSDQIGGAYQGIIEKIENNRYEAAQNDIEQLKTLLADPSLSSLPSVAKRREVDQYLLSTLEDNLETKTSETPAETSSIVEAANLLIGARELVGRGTTALENGRQTTAERLYTAALKEVPALHKAYTGLLSIRRNEYTETINAQIEQGNKLLEEGNIDAAVNQYREALAATTAADEEAAGRALGNIIQVLSGRERRGIDEKNEVIAGLNDRVRRLRTTVEEKNEVIADREEEIAALENELAREIEERNSTIAALNTTIEEKDAAADRLAATIERRDETIEQLNTELNKQRNEIGSLTDRLADKTKEADRLSNSLMDTEGRTGELSASIREKDERLEELTGEVRELKDEISRLETVVAEAEKDRAAAMTEKERTIEQLHEQSRAENETIEELQNELSKPQELVAKEELKEAEKEGRQSAFEDIIDYLAYISAEDARETDLKRKIESQAEDDFHYRNAIEEIHEVIAKTDITESDEVVKVETKLLGTISSVATNTVVIEPLVTIPVEEGAMILIKRKISAEREQTIARGNVFNVSAGRIAARLQQLASSSQRPRVMDLVYLEVSQTD